MKSLKVQYAVLMVTALLIVIVLVLCIAGIRRKQSQESLQEPSETVIRDTESEVAGERITKAEAVRLFSYFCYTEEEKSALSGTGKFRKEENLNCGDFRDMLQQVCSANKIPMGQVAAKLPQRLETVRNKDELLLEEFLRIYYLCLELMAATDAADKTLQIKRTSFLVMKVIEREGEQYFVSETGESYLCTGLQDYSDVFAGTVRTDSIRSAAEPEQYLYEVLNVLCCGNEIVFITGYDNRAVTVPNALIVYGTGDTLDSYINGNASKLQCAFPLKDNIEKQVADITIQNKKVSSLVLKPDTIRGKVLLTGAQQIEVEGYGVLPLQEDYRIYKLYGKYAMEQTNSILVGYDNVTFVVEGNEICAVLIREAIKAENIRVLISVDRTANYLHEKVVLSSKDYFTSTVGDVVREHMPGEELVLDYEKLKDSKERIVVSTKTEDGKITVNSIRRSYGIPGYRGHLEVAVADGGLVLVNELALEEYLYSVVPSEMPVSHGEEALKVQAVCARSYAYQQLLANRYAGYGAHIDDTVNCQVYNNAAETQSSVFAVKDTYGQIMQYEDIPVSAFYFSTSSGYTSSIEEVWQDYAPTEYFSGKIQLTEDSRKALLLEVPEQALQEISLSEESVFRKFIRDEVLVLQSEEKQIEKKVSTYDSEFSWYRWQVTLDAQELAEQTDRLLGARIAANPNEILTRISTEGSFVTPSGAELEGEFAPADITTVGRILAIEPVSRAKSGMLTEILIRGSEHTVLVRNQTNIRTLLAPLHTTVYLANDVTVEGFSLMPSAFFYVEPGTRDGKTVFVFYGGGYGHGVGMSQNGVKNLAKAGYTYEEILEHYYSGVSIGFIY